MAYIRIGADAASVARIIALVLAGLGIAVTQMVAQLGGQAASLIAGGFRSRPKTTKASAKAKPPRGPTNGGTKRPAPSNVVHLDAAKHSVKSWIDKATVAGGEMRGGEVSRLTSAMPAGWQRT
jgi:hypothetical protein